MKRMMLVLLALLAPVAFGATHDAKSSDTQDSVRAKQDVLWGHMEGAIRGIVHETDAVVGVAIVDLADPQRSFYLNADAVYPTASTIKIAVLAELYRQNERGSGSKLGDLYTVNAKDGVGTEGILQAMSAGVSRITNHDLALLMVSLSDNSATNVLIDRVGMDNVNTWLTQLGLERTRQRTAHGRKRGSGTARRADRCQAAAAVHSGRSLDGRRSYPHVPAGIPRTGCGLGHGRQLARTADISLS